MGLAILAYIAGVLTVAAPCILPLLPVILGGTLTSNTDNKTKVWWSPLAIAGGLTVSVVLFTLLLKATTALLGVPQMFWNILSGLIVALFGINLLAPILWEKLMVLTGLHLASNRLLGASYKQKGIARDVLIGAALGPVFSSCSPTYALIVAAILPVSFAKGLVYLILYALGLASALLLVAFAGQSLVRRLGWLTNPGGLFRKVIGSVFIIVGLAVIFGLDRTLQANILERGWYDPIMRLEQRFNLN